ncbi:MAG: histidine phosphatase family protein [Gammaproteobacteria bacterium]|nr:histidine phosphatase family protein [Gammaproteobacteria bacterium]NNF62343.1 histidine phosphatase family protein [Gammaproteobacteria bacterium]NNM21342.1 histidine phosphatase family protein [Gammaproteobacteria bacterium]
MKQIALMRHAKSSWKNRELDDIDRPLNKRGLRDAPMMGGRLAELDYKPDHIVSSTAVRAAVTARTVAQEIGFKASKIQPEKRLYLADPEEIFDIIRELDDKHERVMLFGHNPGFTIAANQIGDLSVDNMPTGAIAVFNLNIDAWKDCTNRCGKLKFFDFPKNPIKL